MGNSKKIDYLYDAAGIKLRQRSMDSDTLVGQTDYIGEAVYENDNMQFLHTSQGRVLKDDGKWVYEYHHCDHLGNLRLAVGEGQEERREYPEYEGTMEDPAEADVFLNWEDVRVPYTELEGNYAMRLQAPDKEVGLFKEFDVHEDEEIQAEVQFRVEAWDDNHPYESIPEHFSVQNPDGSISQIGVDNIALHFEGWPVRYLSAYLALLFVDAEGNYISEAGGNWNNSSQIYLVDDFEFFFWYGGQAYVSGYAPAGAVKAYVYVANETETGVYFDDLQITHHRIIPGRGPVIQENHYYPFGMTMAGLQKIGNPNHRFTFNEGSEYTSVFDLNIFETPFRIYDPSGVIWWQSDPKADDPDLVAWSPHHFSFNNPIRYNDPLGDEPPTEDPLYTKMQELKQQVSQMVAAVKNKLQETSESTTKAVDGFVNTVVAAADKLDKSIQGTDKTRQKGGMPIEGDEKGPIGPVEAIDQDTPIDDALIIAAGALGGGVVKNIAQLASGLSEVYKIGLEMGKKKEDVKKIKASDYKLDRIGLPSRAGSGGHSNIPGNDSVRENRYYERGSNKLFLIDTTRKRELFKN